MEKRLTQKSLFPFGVLLLNLLLIGSLSSVFSGLPGPFPLSCTQPLAQAILLALGITLVLNLLTTAVWRKRWFRPSRLSLLVLAGLGPLVFWLGSSAYSPLSFSNGNSSISHGFLITSRGRVSQPLASGEILSLQAGSPVGISLLSDLPNLACQWKSLNGGAFDDPGNCDLAYSPPAADFDILTVRVEPGCKLPPWHGQIKISILP
jgi:hypothetical protein